MKYKWQKIFQIGVENYPLNANVTKWARRRLLCPDNWYGFGMQMFCRQGGMFLRSEISHYLHQIVKFLVGKQNWKLEHPKSNVNLIWGVKVFSVFFRLYLDSCQKETFSDILICFDHVFWLIVNEMVIHLDKLLKLNQKCPYLTRQ